MNNINSVIARLYDDYFVKSIINDTRCYRFLMREETFIKENLTPYEKFVIANIKLNSVCRRIIGRYTIKKTNHKDISEWRLYKRGKLIATKEVPTTIVKFKGL